MVIFANGSDITNKFYEDDDFRESFTDIDVEKSVRESDQRISVTVAFSSGISRLSSTF